MEDMERLKKSSFVTQVGVEADMLSLPPTTSPSLYLEYIVVKEIPNTIKAEIDAWGSSSGSGIQYELPSTILELIKEGYLIEI